MRRLLARLNARRDRCIVPRDVRGAGTCLRGTPGCPVAHEHTTQLPTINFNR